jgi:hypothetical protein
MSLGEAWVSVFRSATDAKPMQSESIEAVLAGIRDGRWEKPVQRVRETLARDGEEAYKKAKKSLAALTFAGEFFKRANGALGKHSGYICLDIDDVEDLDEVRKRVWADPYTVWVFVSPSGAGLKVGLKIPEAKNAEEHRGYFEAIDAYYRDVLGVTLDHAGKDVARLCFVSWDPSILVRVNAADFGEEIERQKAMKNAKPRERAQKQGSVIEGFNRAHSIEEMLEKHGYTRRGNRYVRPGGSSPSVQINGGKSFHHSSSDPLHGEHLVDPFDVYCALEHGGSIIDAVREAAEALGCGYKDQSRSPHLRARGKKKAPGRDTSGAEGENPDGGPPAPGPPYSGESQTVRAQEDERFFWYVRWVGQKKTRAVLDIRHDLLLEHLGGEGYSKIYSPGQQESIFVRMGEHVAERVSAEMMRDTVMRYVEALPDWLPGCGDEHMHRDRLREHLVRGANVYFAPPPLQCIAPVEPRFVRDTRDAVYFFYTNGYREITRDGDAFLPYSDLDGVIWRNQQIPRDYLAADLAPGEMQRFVELICHEDAERVTALRTALGYLLSRHKNPACAKAVVLLDEKIADDPDGRSGKSLLASALGHMRNVLTIDGKMVNVTNQFSFQALELDTDIMVLDDIPRRFPFEQLFHMITGDLEFERKGKQRIIMPFSDAPKFLLTTNYTITDSGGSSEDRRVEYELHPHFSPSYRPVDEFGHVLFDDWDAAEWARFDDYMAGCVILYLAKGLINAKAVNSDKRKLLQATSKDFVEWMGIKADANEIFGDWKVKDALYNEFTGAYADWKKMEDRGKFSRHAFSRWLAAYARFTGLVYDEAVKWFDGKAMRAVQFTRPEPNNLTE